jgi:GTP cyclohydrolase II
MNAQGRRTLADGAEAANDAGADISIDVSTRLPTRDGVFDIALFTYRPTGEQHLALLRERRPDARPLVRLHSECRTGDLFGSLRCDCGPQLQATMARMGRIDHGYVIYLHQEGRGIGLLDKLRAYRLQETGLDTVEANERLGVPVDGRRYEAAAAFLQSRGVSRVRLLTHNPDKIGQLQRCGLSVTREPLKVGANVHNRAYIATKVSRMGHLG